MSSLTTLPTTDYDADSTITVALMTALYQNGFIGNLIAATEITSSGTHVLDSDTRITLAFLIGGGSGGSGANVTAGMQCGIGGKAGAQALSVYSSWTGGETLTVAIGAGGAGGTYTGYSGAGGTTTLTNHTSAPGGNSVANQLSNAYGSQPGENGFLAGGAGRSTTGAGISAAANTGGGGGGATVLSGGPQNGGSGGSGRVLILEFSGV